MSDGERISKQQCQKNIDKVVDKIFEEMKNTNEVYDRGNRLRCDGKVQLVRSYNDHDGKVKLSGTNNFLKPFTPIVLNEYQKNFIDLEFKRLKLKNSKRFWYKKNNEQIVDEIIAKYDYQYSFTLPKQLVIEHLQLQIKPPSSPYYKYEGLTRDELDQIPSISRNPVQFENLNPSQQGYITNKVKKLFKEKKSWFKSNTQVANEIINRIFSEYGYHLKVEDISQILINAELIKKPLPIETAKQEEKPFSQNFNRFILREEEKDEDQQQQQKQFEDATDFGISPTSDLSPNISPASVISPFHDTTVSRSSNSINYQRLPREEEKVEEEEEERKSLTAGKKRTRRYKRRLRRYTKRYKRHAR